MSLKQVITNHCECFHFICNFKCSHEFSPVFVFVFFKIYLFILEEGGGRARAVGGAKGKKGKKQTADCRADLGLDLRTLRS